MTTSHRGFTLIELLVVIAIIGLLASTILASFTQVQTRNRDARRLSDLSQIARAVELYANENGSYPGTYGTFYYVNENNLGGENPTACATNPPYLKPHIQTDLCNFKDPQGWSYVYARTNDNRQYKLGARFETSARQSIPFVYGSGSTPVSGWFEPSGN